MIIFTFIDFHSTKSRMKNRSNLKKGLEWIDHIYFPYSCNHTQTKDSKASTKYAHKQN